MGTKPSRDLEGRCFYSSNVIAVYCVLNLPVGTFLYALNIARRGNRLAGYGVAAISLGSLLGMLWVRAWGGQVTNFLVISILAGIALLKAEDRPYRLALSRGGATARWWPPALWACGASLCVWAAAFLSASLTIES